MQVNTEITFPRNLENFPHTLPQWITFLIFISQKILLNIKDAEFDFSMGCLLVLFLFLSIINVQFTIFEFLILFSNIAILAYFENYHFYC